MYLIWYSTEKDEKVPALFFMEKELFLNVLPKLFKGAL